MFNMSQKFMTSLWDIMTNSIPLLKQIGRVNSFSSLINEPPAESGTIEINQIKSIKVNNLFYQYGKKQVFNNFSCEMQKGDIVWLRGSSGSGKSTLINLISGLIQSPNNAIFIDGIDINTLNKENLLNHISLLTQGDLLFHDSIKQYILRGNKNLTKKEFDLVTNQCYVDRFGLPVEYLCAFKNSYISFGQAKMICLARFLQKP
jgi:ABC-type multidrug transport system fused ATPase/permease subunit